MKVLHKVVRIQVFLVALSLLTATFQSSEAQSNPLLISQISFPQSVQTGATASGLITYQNAQSGIDSIQMGVVDGRYQHQQIRPSGSSASGQVVFELECTVFSQEVSLRVLLIDNGGRISEPKLLKFNCGRPPFYNFSREQARVRPTTEKIRINFFILDDGITSLTEGARPTGNPLWSLPAEATLKAIKDAVVPALTGIWDQCSLSFELGQVLIVDPKQLIIQQGSLDQLLFSRQGEEKVITHGARSGAFLTQAQLTLSDELRVQGSPITLDNLIVFVTGSPIVTTTGGKTSYIEGFGELSALVQGFSLVRPRYAIVRWGALHYESGRVLTPKQVVATLAHELGHNLGLKHPGEDGLRDTLADDDNLMKGSGVTPEPRANLLNSQCQQFLKIWSEMRRQVKAWSLRINPGRFIKNEGQSAILFPDPDQDDLARGFIEQRSAFKLTILNNSALAWVVKISVSNSDLGRSYDGLYSKPVEDLMVQTDGGGYFPLSAQAQTLLAGANGEFRFDIDFKVLYKKETHRPGAYRAEVIYTVMNR